MAGIEQRLNRLESSLGSGPCVACGERDLHPGERLVFKRIDLNADPAPRPEYRQCSTCGRLPLASRFCAVTFDGDKQAVTA